MKVYVAGRWTRKTEAREAQRALVAAGHSITHDWTAADDTGMAGEEQIAYHSEQARADVEGVFRADALVLLHDNTGRGLFVELGLALADPCKAIVVIGAPRDAEACVFYHLPWIAHVATVAEAVAALSPVTMTYVETRP
jgi:hypothetical protein